MTSVIKLAASCIVMKQLELVTVTNNTNYLYSLFFVLLRLSYSQYGLVYFLGQEDQFHKPHKRGGGSRTSSKNNDESKKQWNYNLIKSTLKVKLKDIVHKLTNEKSKCSLDF